jgi:hypothetical protein
VRHLPFQLSCFSRLFIKRKTATVTPACLRMHSRCFGPGCRHHVGHLCRLLQEMREQYPEGLSEDAPARRTHENVLWALLMAGRFGQACSMMAQMHRIGWKASQAAISVRACHHPCWAAGAVTPHCFLLRGYLHVILPLLGPVLLMIPCPVIESRQRRSGALERHETASCQPSSLA